MDIFSAEKRKRWVCRWYKSTKVICNSLLNTACFTHEDGSSQIAIAVQSNFLSQTWGQVQTLFLANHLQNLRDLQYWDENTSVPIWSWYIGMAHRDLLISTRAAASGGNSGDSMSSYCAANLLAISLCQVAYTHLHSQPSFKVYVLKTAEWASTTIYRISLCSSCPHSTESTSKQLGQTALVKLLKFSCEWKLTWRVANTINWNGSRHLLRPWLFRASKPSKPTVFKIFVQMNHNTQLDVIRHANEIKWSGIYYEHYT